MMPILSIALKRFEICPTHIAPWNRTVFEF